MSEQLYNVVQLGRQSAIGTPVAATTRFPVDAGFLGFELDRAAEAPDEDFGSTSLEQPGRQTYGTRWASTDMPFVCRFEDITHILEMHVATITGPAAGTGQYTWAYLFDESANLLSTALKPYTAEYGVPGSTQDEWRATGVLAGRLQMGFDALSGPANAMWKGSAGLVAVNRARNALTGSLSAPAALETMEGHKTTFAEGSTSTAFASLTARTATLKQFQFASDIKPVGRYYGGSDIASDVGRSGKGTVEFDAMVATTSTMKTDVLDVFEESTNVATERRWRLTVTGDGVNSMTIDARVRFRATNMGEHDGERLYSVRGVWVYDSTLVGRGKITVVNANSAHA